MHVVFVSSEVFPYAKTGGLGDVCGTLPLALEKQGLRVSIVLPRYKIVDPGKFRLERIHRLAWHTTLGKKIDVYLIESERFFSREGLYGYSGGDYQDNLERFHYFCLKTLELFKILKKRVDIFHAHDWQAALVPILLRSVFKNDSFYRETRSAQTVHNLAYQGVFPKSQFSSLGLAKNVYSIYGLEYFEQINLLKGGIIYSDRVTTVSPQYAKEIQTPRFGCGLEGVLRSRKEGVLGILNGLDTEIWNPETDGFIDAVYSRKNLQDKVLDKTALQKELGFTVNPSVPLMGFVGRLTPQKGLELIRSAFDKILKWEIQLVFLGIGEEKYQRLLKQTAARHPKKVAARLRFSEEAAHRVYAGCDLFLMPSTYEPCGLSQMISLRYGTIPLVFKTGGLADTVTPFDARSGTGFVFDRYNETSFIKAFHDALTAFKNKKVFREAMLRGMSCDFSWQRSAKEYMKLYDALMR